MALIDTFRTEADLALLRSIRQYPSLFQNRTQVLEHWFLCIGNGYEWENGILVPVFGECKPDRLDESEAAMFAARPGWCGVHPPSGIKAEKIYDAASANDDWRALAEELCGTLLGWDLLDYESASRFFYPTLAEQYRDALEQWLPILAGLFPAALPARTRPTLPLGECSV